MVKLYKVFCIYIRVTEIKDLLADRTLTNAEALSKDQLNSICIIRNNILNVDGKGKKQRVLSSWQ